MNKEKGKGRITESKLDKGENGKDISEDEVEEGRHKGEKELYCALGEVQKFTFRIFHYAVSKAHNKHFIILVCTTISHSTY